MFSSDQPLVANQLPISVEFPRDQQEFINTISLLYKRIANAVNTKEGALYLPQELATFQLYFTPNDPQRLRNVYRKTIDFGSLPNTAAKAVPHGITFNSNFSTTRIYGSATDPVNLVYIPLPFADPTPANNISLFLDSTNVYVTAGSNRSNFTRCTVVIEYVKNQ